MNRALVLYVGVLCTIIASALGFVLLLESQLRGLEPLTGEDGLTRPAEPGGLVAEGWKL